MFACNNFPFCAFVTMIYWTSTEVFIVQTPLLHKGVMKFSKDGCNGGDGKFLLGMGERGSQEWGVGFIMEGYEIFKVSLHGW